MAAIQPPRPRTTVVPTTEVPEALTAGADESANEHLLGLLPEEMWAELLTFCDDVSLCRLAATCRLMHRVACDDAVWRVQYAMSYPDTKFIPIDDAYREIMDEECTYYHPSIPRWSGRYIPDYDENALKTFDVVTQEPVGGGGARSRMLVVDDRTEEEIARNKENADKWKAAYREHKHSVPAEKVKAVLFRCLIDPMTVIKAMPQGDPAKAVIFATTDAVRSPFCKSDDLYDIRYAYRQEYPEVPFGCWKQAYIDRLFLGEMHARVMREMEELADIRRCGKTCQLRGELDAYLDGFTAHPSTSEELVVEFGAPLLDGAKDTLMFMSFVNGIPEFGEETYVRRALVRYHKFMQLYERDNTLHPALDVDVVWQAHLIRTAEYRSYCAAAFGHLVDRQLVLSHSEKKARLERTKSVWKSAYGEEYIITFDDLLAIPLEEGSKSWPYGGKAVESLVYGTIKDRDWLNEVEMAQWYQEVDWSDDQLYVRALKAYEKFLYLTATQPDYEDCPGPTDLIDLCWHAHQMNPVAYTRDCERLTGKVLDHDPWPTTTPDNYQRFLMREEDMWRGDFGHVQWVMTDKWSSNGVPTAEDLARYVAHGCQPC